MLLCACGADDRRASSPVETSVDERSAPVLEPFSQADVERAFAGVGLDVQLMELREGEVACEPEPPESAAQKLERTCHRYVLNLGPPSPDPRVLGSGGQDASFWSVAVWASEAEAQEAEASSAGVKMSWTPASEGWRSERAGNVIVLYSEPMQTLIRSALKRL
jgi:hypothetical protein